MLNFRSSLDTKIKELEAQKEAFEDTIAVGTKISWAEGLTRRTGAVVDVAIDSDSGAVVYKVEPDRLRDRPDLADKPMPLKMIYPHQNVIEV